MLSGFKEMAADYGYKSKDQKGVLVLTRVVFEDLGEPRANKLTSIIYCKTNLEKKEISISSVLNETSPIKEFSGTENWINRYVGIKSREEMRRIQIVSITKRILCSEADRMIGKLNRIAEAEGFVVIYKATPIQVFKS